MENKFESKMKEMDEFADELKVFIETVMVNVGAVKFDPEQIVTLFAIYKKNGRAERMNGNYRPKSNPNAPATEKQKNAILSFVGRGQIDKVDVESLTKGEASKLLDKAFGKGASAPSSIPNLYETEDVPDYTYKLQTDLKGHSNCSS